MKNVLFIMHVFDESRGQVANNINRLRMFYPNSPIMIIYDGVPSQNHIGVTEILGDRVKIEGKSGTFTDRYLKAFLNTDAQFCIKIDPDTEIVQRLIEPLPDKLDPIIFCRVEKFGLPHGGALGVNRSMAKLLTDMHWLTLPFRCDGDIAMQDPILKRLIQIHKLTCLHRPDFGYSDDPKPTDVFRHSRINSRANKH